MKIFKNIGSWSLPDLFDIPFKIIIYFTLIGYLEKFDFGLLNIAMMIFSYQALSQIGIVDWLMYELPKKYAHKEESGSLISESFTFVLVNQIILMTVVIFFIYFYGNDSIFFYSACAAYIFHTLFYNSYLHRKLYLRFSHRFPILLKVQLLYVIVRFISQITALNFFGIYAFFIVESLIFLLPITIFWKNNNIRLYDRRWISNYSKLITKGFPFFVVILVSTILANVDRWFVVAIFGVENFAIYSVGVFITTGIMIFPGKAFSIFIQYMKEMYTLISDIKLNIHRSFSVNNLLVYFVTTIILILNYFSELIIIIIPEYDAVIPLLNLLFLAAILKYAASLTSNILYLTGKRVLVAKLQVFLAISYVFALSMSINSQSEMTFVIIILTIILGIQIIINLALILILEKAKISSEFIKFIFLIISTSSFFYLNEYLNNNLVIIYCLVLINVIFLINFKETWTNLKYIGNRKFI